MHGNPDVLYCARQIVRDLVPIWWPDRPSWKDLCLLTDLHGGVPLIDPDLCARRAAKCHDGEIILSPACTLRQYREFIPHELVHRLADTPRWSWLNDDIPGWRYSRHEFVEAVAWQVGRMFAARLNSQRTTL